MQGQLDRARTDKRRLEMEEQLALPPFPEAVRYLWKAFWDLRSRRGGNGFGPSPLSWSDIDAYNRLTGAQFAPWEVQILTAVDDTWLVSFQDQPAEEPT